MTTDEQRPPEGEPSRQVSAGDGAKVIKQTTPTSERFLRCLRHWKPLIDFANVVLVAAVIITAIIAWSSDTTFHAEMQLLSTERQHLARDEFNKALDEAEAYCGDCQQCAPPFGILIPLDKAAVRASELGDKLTAAEYNRLAILGSSVWEIDKASGYAKLALANKNNSQLDTSMSYLVLAHLSFLNYRSDNTNIAELKQARIHFNNAIKGIDNHYQSDAYHFYLGQAHSLWAIHERGSRFADSPKEYEEHHKEVVANWQNLQNGKQLLQQHMVQTVQASDDRIPNIGCMFRARNGNPGGGGTSPCAPCGVAESFGEAEYVNFPLSDCALALGVSENEALELAKTGQLGGCTMVGNGHETTLYSVKFYPKASVFKIPYPKNAVVPAAPAPAEVPMPFVPEPIPPARAKPTMNKSRQMPTPADPQNRQVSDNDDSTNIPLVAPLPTSNGS